MLDLSVVVISWNTCALLEKCLYSLACQETDYKVELIVVDNASEDSSREMVKEQFPDVNLIANTTNIGFGAGNNTALPIAVGRYILFLNSDTVVMEGALDLLLKYADSNPDIGIVGPKLLNEDGSLQYSCRQYPNIGTGFFRNTILGKLFPSNRFTSDYLLQNWDHAEPRDVDWVSGAALMMRRSLIDEIGCFDEEYYMYCEDVDLCWRVNHTTLPGKREEIEWKPYGPHGREEGRRCWKVAYFPDAVVYHLIGKSSDKAPTRMTYEFHRSQYLFYQKHYAASTPFLLRLIIPAGIAIRAAGQMSKYQINYWRRRMLGIEKRKK